ncbi:uncharacterized protein KRP23_5667 [Phytophthora ramorum]|uniref:uncharacterized protein n=1 Tax=Phytophthora ramorum TaxID=164328 RepID=UPI00309F3407|nr:hypothetical protein KRP23_5667 [Phytophthora ramorum]
MSGLAALEISKPLLSDSQCADTKRMRLGRFLPSGYNFSKMVVSVRAGTLLTHAGEARREQPQRTGAVRHGDDGVADGGHGQVVLGATSAGPSEFANELRVVQQRMQ